MSKIRSRVSLEQIFGSRARVRLLKLFLERPDEHFYVREISRYTRSHIHSVRRELANLVKIGLIRICEGNSIGVRKIHDHLQRKYYSANPRCIIFYELQALLVKGQLFLQEELARQIARVGAIKYLALTGFFVNLQGSPIDLFIVGKISKKKCAKFIADFEQEFGRTINYTVFSIKEYMERKEITDRFLYNFFESQKIVLIDKLPISQRMGI